MLVPFALLAVLASAEPAAPPTTVSPLIVSPMRKPPPADAQVDVPGSDEAIGNFVAVWPQTAYRTRQDGRVRLSCRVDTYGLAEACSVVSETPAGKGFGKAALQLRPTFKLTPKTGPDGLPVTAMMSINIAFTAPQLELDTRRMTEELRRAASSRLPAGPMDFQLRGNPLQMRDVTMLDNPVWGEAAGYEDVARAYPAQARDIEGYAAAHCRVARTGADVGSLTGCTVIKEAPEKTGFGAAALALAAKFRVDPASLAEAPRGAPLWVDIPIRFPAPSSGAAATPTVAAPVWLRGFDPLTAPKVFPPEAMDRGVTSGRGVARCTVGADGGLLRCTPDGGEPEGLGFSEAVAKLAGTMRMNLWSADAAPVRGGVVRVAMRLNLKGD